MDAAYKKYTIAQSVKLNFIEKCSNMKVKHPKDYWLEYEREKCWKTSMKQQACRQEYQ